jgi:hypothetical protein
MSKLERSELSPDRAIDSALSPSYSSLLLEAAHSIYQIYDKNCFDQRQKPSGVAVDRLSLRGKLVFAVQPVLLPSECFIPLSQINQVNQTRLI